MASIVDRIRIFARGPKGQRMLTQAQRQLRDPRHQQRLRQLAQRLRGRSRRY